jgi:hypothetical protein
MSEIHDQREQIITELEELNDELHAQNSKRQTLLRGIMYGIGIFIGSAIIATAILGIISPWLGEVGWIRDLFQRGSELR